MQTAASIHHRQTASAYAHTTFQQTLAKPSCSRFLSLMLFTVAKCCELLLQIVGGGGAGR